jgi:hypothetical protein
MHLAETELKGGVDETTCSAEVQVDGGTPPFHYILDSRPPDVRERETLVNKGVIHHSRVRL